MNAERQLTAEIAAGVNFNPNLFCPHSGIGVRTKGVIKE